MTGIATWAKERFDGAAVFSTLLLYFTVAIPSRVFADQSFIVGWEDAIASLVLVSFFLLLRIFDEHKDYQEDLVLHPGRVLSRGIVSLKKLKIVGAICLMIQVLVLFISDFETTVFFLVSLTWGFLMLKEFFVRDWLKRHAFLYVLSHMFIATLVSFWIMSVVGISAEKVFQFWPMAALPFVMGFLYELSRKSFGFDEDPRIESYLKVFGQTRLVVLIAVLVGFGVFLSFRIFEILGIEKWTYAVLLFYALIALGWKKYLKAPTLKNRKGNMGVTGLSILLIYSFIIFYAWHQHGPTV